MGCVSSIFARSQTPRNSDGSGGSSLCFVLGLLLLAHLLSAFFLRNVDYFSFLPLLVLVCTFLVDFSHVSRVYGTVYGIKIILLQYDDSVGRRNIFYRGKVVYFREDLYER